MEGIWLRRVVVLIASTLAGAASALPVVSVDSNPGLAGVQADSDVLEGLPLEANDRFKHKATEFCPFIHAGKACTVVRGRYILNLRQHVVR